MGPIPLPRAPVAPTPSGVWPGPRGAQRAQWCKTASMSQAFSPSAKLEVFLSPVLKSIVTYCDPEQHLCVVPFSLGRSSECLPRTPTIPSTLGWCGAQEELMETSCLFACLFLCLYLGGCPSGGFVWQYLAALLRRWVEMGLLTVPGCSVPGLSTQKCQP